ncbi:integrin alpha-PS1-like isoform X2 [Varroa destructor]|uniref:Uncharacterized protein n=1 Tax=Varroa destructor TaxID=109461 RepID=A0A7M7K3M0_VARDE|nr:integrin alpha-PS1-like isoform X2 [Varroa destructor]
MSMIDNEIIVGAPKQDRSGAVMACDIFSQPRLMSQSSCQKLPFFDSFEEQGQGNMTDMWFGVSVSSGQQNGLMACAHRYVKPTTIINENNVHEEQRLGFGICFQYSTSLVPEAAWVPCDGQPVKDYHLGFGLCQAGTSCHLNSKYDVQTIGMPGTKTWRGGVSSFMKRDKYIREWLRTNTDSSYPVENYAYLGMSVASGNFFDKQRLGWAAGAPRANDTGAVLLFERNRAPNNNELEHNRTLIGEQVASSFGYVIAVVDINSDGLDDLVVGAPFYYEDGVGGAVHVYLNEGAPRYLYQGMQYRKVIGSKEESRFGFAITGLGDIDRDGFNDLAIGAPYEGDGAVYIYLGSKNGLSERPSQIIRASDVKRTRTVPSTFGYSLSGGVDLDNNKYPDLVVGAYSSDRAFAIYARPIKNIKAELRYSLPIDPTTEKCLSGKEVCTTFQVCLTTPSDFDHRTGDLIVVQRIEAETFQPNKKKSRVIFKKAKNTETPHILVESFQMTDYSKCTTGELILVDRSDIHTTIKLKLTLDLDNDLDRNDRLHVPRIDQYPILNKKLGTLTIPVDFKKNCGDNAVCESTLYTESKLNLPNEKGEPVYYLGWETMNLTVSVRNTGESAYDAFLHIEHPSEMTFIGRSVLNKKSVLDCSTENQTLVRCDLGNPMENGDLAELLLKFRPEREADDLTTMRFVVHTTTSSQDTLNQRPTTFDVSVVRAAELEIKGLAKPEQVWYGGRVVGASAMQSEAEIGSEVTHVYSVFNYGPYMVPNFKVHIRWPMEVENSRKNGKYLLYLTELPKVQVNGVLTSCRAVKDNSVDPLGFTNKQAIVATEAPTAAASRSRPSTLRIPQKKSTDPVIRRTTTTTTPKPTTEDDYDYDADYGEARPTTTTTPKTIYARKVITERNYTYVSSYGRNTRVRRDMIVPAESVRVDGRVLNVVKMRCNQNTRCVDFSCTVTNLQKHNSAVITIKSRLWNATFVEDYPRVDQVSIFSFAEIRLDPEIDIRQKTTNDYAEAETKAYPDSSLYQRSEGAPWWVIALGVIIGILILVAIAYCLYKMDFFKRNQHLRNGEYEPVSQTEKKELTQFSQYPDSNFH